MLNFQKLMAQIENVGRDSLVDKFPQEQIRQAAKQAYEDAALRPDDILQRLQLNQEEVLWPVSLPLEPFGMKLTVPEFNQPLSALAVDGSQIMPSRHEVHSCYVLNIGKVAIAYGSRLTPCLESEPRLYHRREDLYPLVDRRRLYIDELYVSLERNILELEELCALALDWQKSGLPVVALLDGSLMTWSLEKMSPGYQSEYCRRWCKCLESFQDARIPLLGYISGSRAGDLLNDLRITVCPYELSSCRKHCGQLNEEDFPCSKIWPLADRQLLSEQLSYGQRSAVYLSGASMSLRFPAALKTCFCYLQVGAEVARLEFPRFVADQPELLQLACGVVLSQVKKGSGYPLVLAEAHNLAVINGADRRGFFELLTRQLLSLGVKSVGVSPKESRKRQGIV